MSVVKALKLVFFCYTYVPTINKDHSTLYSTLPFTTMLNVRVDMGKLYCGMQTQQWKNGIVF